MSLTCHFPHRSRAGRTHRVSGLSIVELLVGIAVGLFVLAGATMVASNQISDNKRLLLETQIQQDMRAAMDIIVRDIRRSGFSFHADRPQAVGGAVPVLNGYSPAGVLNAGTELEYTYSQETTASENNVADPDDFRGFRLQGEAIQVQLGQGKFQALTDPSVVRITTFTAIPAVTVLNLPTCPAPGPCPSANACGNQRIETRNIVLVMVGQALNDPSVQRRIDATVRVRNDRVCL
ncbi:hypothetical protein HLB44_28250 [Aquincola sp. S2]|uniref:Prepilin-type N-terminal cleavage/methylation domain-containing protein n=1 Tax=Pseudaquabacterium terrae TaxID=2732868 RepID=A0ABX2EQQ4_9BURK|nr:hypothetical protein [Aquabacterium terrae]NRF70904.1 hypothetical protein [Aquabacterium terrae]